MEGDEVAFDGLEELVDCEFLDFGVGFFAFEKGADFEGLVFFRADFLLMTLLQTLNIHLPLLHPPLYLHYLLCQLPYLSQQHLVLLLQRVLYLLAQLMSHFKVFLQLLDSVHKFLFFVNRMLLNLELFF